MLPQASAGPSFQRGDVEREVPGDDQPDDAERLAESQVDAAGDGDRLAVVLVDGAGVEVEDVGDHADLAARAADRLADVCGLDPRELFAVLLDERREPPEQPPAVGRRNARQAGNAVRARATAASVSSTPADSSVAIVSSVAGLMTVTVTAAI